MRVAVVSAVFGGYDEPVFTPQTIPCSYTLVSDDSVLVPRDADHQWFQVGGLHPRLVGKFVKCRPWEYADADVFVWLDGSIQPEPGLVEQMIEDLGDGDIAFHPHPDRTSVIAEAQASIPMPKYEGHDVMAQAQAYVDAGHPDDWGLWASTLFVLRDSASVRQFGGLWLDEICRWTVQDQLPLPVVLRQSGLDVRPLSGGLRGNRLFGIRRHSDRT